MPSKISFYLNVPSRVDPSAAPCGCDAIVVLVPIGHLSEDGINILDDAAWKTLVNEARRQVLGIIKHRLKIDVGKSIVHEMVNTPVTCEYAQCFSTLPMSGTCL
jgi:phytoene desaturase (3,4-didehydrolycopene-forming)